MGRNCAIQVGRVTDPSVVAIQPRLITDSLYAIHNGALAGFGDAMGFTYIILRIFAMIACCST